MFRRINRGDHLTDEALSAQSVALIVKRYAEAAGLDFEKLSGHSLRAGFVTSAAENRASISRIMEVTRHRDPRTVETYVRRTDRFKYPPAMVFCEIVFIHRTAEKEISHRTSFPRSGLV
ncbi:tyrosine-type recombinase/integrase [Neorhizobium tomejilense]|uniref:tyrosine-type recombinase/integrase n=1 Tax=Neorhizobium tomejilense TaxID=2093828 RepID=UPI000CF8AED1|nr:tyrosine-type recombinase/integrase [Neorhizobium tomejilense]